MGALFLFPGFKFWPLLGEFPFEADFCPHLFEVLEFSKVQGFWMIPPLVNHQVKVFIRYFLDMPPLPPWNRGNNKECRDRSQKGVLQAVSSLIFSHFPFLCHLSHSNNFAPSRASNKRLNSPDSRTIDENFEFSMVGGRYTGPNGEKMICVP